MAESRQDPGKTGQIMKKGTFGYINHKKKTQLIKTIITFLISFTIMITGYLINDNSKQNIFTIIAVLIVLPGAKMLVGYIVVAPFHSVGEKVFKEVSAKKQGKDELLVDLVFTSPEKIMNLSFLMIKNDKIYCLSEHKKADISYMQKYLQRTVDGRELSFEFIIEKDYALFLKDLEKATEETIEQKDKEELHNLIMTILV